MEQTHDSNQSDQARPQNQSEIPKLETRETLGMRAEYPSLAHLEAGNCGAWMAERQDQLLVKARNERSDMNLSKTITLAATAVGTVCYAVSPLAPLGALVAGIGYCWAVAKDLNDTHQFAPVPFVRGNFLEFLTAMGGKEDREDYFAARDDLVDLLHHLDPFEKIEYAMLREHMTVLTEFLTTVDSGKRFYAYRWLTSVFQKTRGSFPTHGEVAQHLSQVNLDHRVDYHQVTAIQQAQMQPKALFVELPKPQFVELPKVSDLTLKGDSNVPQVDDIATSDDTNITPDSALSDIPSVETFLSLPLQQRADAIAYTLTECGFKIREIMDSQIIAIASSQRGGKGTLAGILSILLKADDSTLNIEYFTAGVDVYPFACNLHSALKHPTKHHGDVADKSIALELMHYLKKLEAATPYSQNNLVLIVDEAMRLSSLLEEEDRVWMMQYLLTRFAKCGGTLILVLHASNLTSVVGSKNTSGLGDTFKSGISFIGCTPKSVNAGGFKKINIASGEYFKANPNNFGNALVPSGELGNIPDFLLKEKHPGNGYPDPVRSLLQYFPELVQSHHDGAIGAQIEQPLSTKISEEIIRLENAFNSESVPEIVTEVDEEQEELSEYYTRFGEDVCQLIMTNQTPPISFDALRSNKIWVSKIGTTKFSRPKLRFILNKLLELCQIEGNEVEGYRSTNTK